MAYKYKGKERDVKPEIAPGCGSNAGYQRHARNNTPTCQACLDAHNASNRAYYKRKKTQLRNECATYPGYMRHKRAGEQACGLCLAAYAQYMRGYRERKAAV